MYLHVQTCPDDLWGTAEWQVLSFQPYRGRLDWREDGYSSALRYRGPASPAEIPMANGLDIPVLLYGNNLSQYGSALVLAQNVQQTATEIALTDSLYATWGGGWQVYGEESGIKYGAMRRSFGNYQYICPMGTTEMLYTRTRWDGYTLQAEVDTVPTGGYTLLGSLPEQPNIRYYTRQPLARTVGAKRYELKDHLGNVRATVSDSRIAWDDGGMQYAADILNHTDYYPYGMGMPGRSYSASDYRFGYQGSEKDDEITGRSGQLYTTFYREMDVMKGYWWSPDPVFQPSWSPYSLMGCNPIWNNDPLGDIFDPKSQKHVDKQKDETRTRLGSAKEDKNRYEQIAAKQTMVSGQVDQATSDKISDLNAQIKEYEDALYEIDVLEKSEQMYRIKPWRVDASTGGKVYSESGTDLSSKTVYIQVDVNNVSNFAHELKHAYQFEINEIAFDYKTGKGTSILYDMTDEYAAYHRGWAYGGSKRSKSWINERYDMGIIELTIDTDLKYKQINYSSHRDIIKQGYPKVYYKGVNEVIKKYLNEAHE